MAHGIALFLLGLLTGLAEPQFVNPRMALAAHLEGVILAAFLLALGAAWGNSRLARLRRVSPISRPFSALTETGR